MSSTLINVGTEPNDGTGDPPRTAFLKANANFQAIDQALVATETTAQLNDRDTANRARANHTGTQPTSTIANFTSEAAAAAPVQSVAGKTGEVLLAKADVGLGQADNTSDIDKPLSTATEAALGHLASSTQAALDQKLEAGDIAAFETNAQLDARDTANRARANHTGTQSANSIEGLSSVATSGAYTDLSGRPNVPFGFTYDQQVEPVGPTAGQTWRERSAGGLIMGEWEWLAAFAEWVAIGSYDIAGLSLTGSGAISFTSKNLQSKKRLIQTASLIVQTTSGTFDASNFLTFTPVYQTNFSTTVLTASAAAFVLNSPGTFNKTTAINGIYTFDTVRIFRGVTGTPGASTSAITTKVRDVRQ